MALAMFVKTGVYESDPTTMLSTLSTPAFALLSLLLVALPILEPKVQDLM